MFALRKLCDDNGVLLIGDEIQTGFARTGKMFGLEHSGVKADVVTMAKGPAGRLPAAAITGRADVMDAANPGGLGGTYAGNPVACAASHVVLDIIKDEDLIGLIQRYRRHHHGPLQDAHGQGQSQLHRRGARPRGHVRRRAGQGPRPAPSPLPS